ncbi:hypothetical protein PLESTB_001864600 [Pleodorina starrii]|uniref:Uncharacterized protein n=1 Tax=Pleodorina starrii TaxID=330485 RepID=A0A9W6C3B6_9CHLO|nr:hypothetical protein PLESTB_001864600 [Pleodorina starrii]GLC74016.1 hypothetical protein PLESTF_001450500 [Pleodorina starrii]
MSEPISTEQLKQVLDAALMPIFAKLGELNDKVSKLDDKVNDLTVGVKILSAKQHNSSVSRADRLVKVPLANGAEPAQDYPESILHLLVAGNETLPNGTVNNWNKHKSQALLRQYAEDSGDESNTEDEYSSRSRARRLRLARCLGITQAQLNFAQLTL